MFVGDTDLNVMGDNLRTSKHVYQEMQDSLHMWDNLLLHTGRATKPDKCFWYLVDYECVNGEWQYKPTVDWEMKVPVPDGPDALIKQKDVHACEETLGVWSCPAGSEDKQYKKITDRVEKWTSRTSNGHLPARYAWVSYKLKLWPGIRYGLSTMATPLKVAAKLLSTYNYRMLSFLGVNRNIKKEWRTIPRAFGGIGLYSFPVEQTICCVNMLVQHFGVPSVLGKKLTASLEAMQLETGLNTNPLVCSYERYGDLTTYCWFKILWERLWHYGFSIHLHHPEIPIPRKNDALIIDLFLAAGHTGSALRGLNRCRICLHMIFLSDMVTTNG